MTDLQRDILAALDVFEWRTLTQVCELAKSFRTPTKLTIKNLVAAGTVQRVTKSNTGNYQRHLYRLAEAA